MAKSTTQKIQEYLYKNLFWILFLFGVLIIYLSSLLEAVYWQAILEKMGLAILSSGVFASVLKSIQFTGIFKSEIEKIVLGSKFIENRNDLPKLWRKISKGVYNKKFPAISEDLENLILDNYFPTNHQYYYEDYRYTLNIEELDENQIIRFTQSYHFYVVLAKDQNEAKMTGSFVIDKRPELANLINERIYYKVDGVDRTKDLNEEISENQFEKRFEYDITITGKKRFLIETKQERSYSMKEDNFKLIRVGAITKEMDVSIKYPDNMIVSFFNIGLIHNFERKHIEHSGTISRCHKKGIILPHQGFGITFGVK